MNGATWMLPPGSAWQDQHGHPPNKPGYAITAIGVSHCGAGCTLGDIVAEFAVLGLGVTVAGTTLLAEYLGDYILALALGIGFQLMHFVFFPAPHHLHPDNSVYWFLMRIGMIAGFFAAWPVNIWLIRAGIKEAM